MATIFRPPFIFKVEPKDPRGIALRAQDGVEPTADLALELKGQDKQFAGPGQWKTYDYPNPIPPRQPISNKTWIDPTKQHLIGKDKQFAGPGQWKAYDYPNPGQLRRSISLYTHVYLALALTAAAPLLPQTTVQEQRWSSTFTYPTVSGLLLTLQPPAAGTPFAQIDWPNPTRRIQPLNQGFTDSFKLPLQTLRPSNQYNWPNPGLLRRNEQLGWLQEGLATTTVVTYPATIIFDYPNPRGPQQYNRSYSDSFKLPLQTLVPNNQYNWPNPTSSRRNEQLGWLQSGLATTTVTVYPASITFDWPNPRGPVGSISLRTWTDSFKLPLQTIVPENQYNWPNPQGAKPNQGLGFTSEGLARSTFVADTTHLPHSLTQEIGWQRAVSYKSVYGSTTLLGSVAAPPFHQTDWLNPRGPAPLNRGFSDSFKLPLQTLVPSNQFDWPVPRGPQQYNRSFSDSFKLPLQSIVPNNEYDWPVPRAAKPNQDLGYTLSSTLYATPVFTPFNQLDWPNPRGAKPVVASWQDSFKLPLQTIVGSNQFDWPNPRGPQRANELLTWLQTGFLEQFGEPFAQTDWPNPRGPQPLNRGTNDSFKLPLQTIVGSNQYDWPNPRGYRRNEQLGWLEPGLGLTTQVVYPATITFDWPNPRGPIQYNRGFTDRFKLPLTTHRPPSIQRDWPVPKGYKRHLDWVIGTPKGMIQPFQAPFYQTNWPVPRGVVRTDQLTWTRRPFLQIQEISPLQPVAGQKLFASYRGMLTTGPNITLVLTPPPIPPEPPVFLPPKTHRGFARSGGGVAMARSGSAQTGTTSGRSQADVRGKSERTDVASGTSKSDAQDP